MRLAPILLVVFMVCGVAGTAAAVDFNNPAFAPGGAATSIPVGHYEFCRTAPGECAANPVVAGAVVLTDENWQQLVDINNAINVAVAPLSDADQYQMAERWVYPTTAGDCEDYVLAKRRALAEQGWPISTLLIAVVQQYSGEGHAVLMARTDRGDVVLDNQDGDIHLWNETPYTYIKRQSQEHAGRWVAIADDRPVITASTHARQ
jgi:predicted transglutaminase-like cysteine proteinase